MTKLDISLKIAQQVGVDQVLAKQVLQATLDSIIEVLATEDRLELRGFGVFEMCVTKAHIQTHGDGWPSSASNASGSTEVPSPRREIRCSPSGGRAEQSGALFPGRSSALHRTSRRHTPRGRYHWPVPSGRQRG
ncbi:MAG: HU family DNA-binding protein [Planctomycetota bacterium]|nr:HU family DNA-binding protein [Planctomycetota bacterium]